MGLLPLLLLCLFVLEHYADSRFRYAGLCDLARYLITGKPSEGQEVEPEDGER